MKYLHRKFVYRSIATVNSGYHVLADDNYYSVPFEFIKKKVDVRLTRTTVEIFYDNRIASHIRILKRQGGYSTREEHMQHSHQPDLLKCGIVIF